MPVTDSLRAFPHVLCEVAHKSKHLLIARSDGPSQYSIGRRWSWADLRAGGGEAVDLAVMDPMQ